MDDSVLDDIIASNDDGQKVKTNEITGKRYQFHSLPKEFQDLHNLYYILEKQGNIDRSAVAKANLNAYFWMSLFDATKYAIFLFGFTVFAILKWSLSNSLTGFIIAMLTYIPVVIFVGYHFIFYMLIKAQVIGPVTKNLAKSTADTFVNMFFSVYLALLVAFLFFIYFLNNLLVIFFYLIVKIYKYVYLHNDFDSIQGIILKYMIIFHNILANITNGKDIVHNIYVYSFIIFIITLLIIGSIAGKYYKDHREEVLKELKREQLKQGYPIEVAQNIITEWRKKQFG